MLPSRRTNYLFYFSCLMVCVYLALGIVLAATNIYHFQNQVIIGIAIIVYGIFRGARLWSLHRNSELE